MKNILHIDASPQGTRSISRQLTADVVSHLKAASPHALVTHRDLIATPVPHLGPELIQILRPIPGSAPPDNAAVRAEVAQTEELLSEFLAADVVVIGAPMFNFSIPSQLKAWIDRIVQAGRTFSYTSEGKVGLAGEKTVIIVSSRGGMYAGSPYEAAMDHQEAYLKAVLDFIGVTDVSYIRAEGIAISPEKRREAIAGAERDIAALTHVFSKAGLIHIRDRICEEPNRLVISYCCRLQDDLADGSTMKLFSGALLDELSAKATASPRGRANHNIHAGADDPVQRFFVVANRSSYFRPHRHRTKSELAFVVRGGFDVLTFDEAGRILARHLVDAGGELLGYETPRATWHTLIAHADGSAFLEIKEGPYDQATAAEFAPWAPPEGDARVPQFLEQLRVAQPGATLRY